MTGRSGRAVLAGAVLTLLTACGTTLDQTTATLARVAGTACLSPILATAVPVGDELWLTVAHAIAGADDDLRVITQEGIELPVRVVAFDPDRDLALLDAPGFEAPPISVSEAAAGDSGVIAVVGGDLTVDRIPFEIKRLVTASSGDIYDQGQVLREAFDLRAEVGPGDSGGPLLNGQGAMVGMLFARSTGKAGSAWALTPAEITAFLESMTDRVDVDRGRCR
ncbi:MAG: trypsin-like peptidase domain-containing protein [Actinomycetota bacterium]